MPSPRRAFLRSQPHRVAIGLIGCGALLGLGGCGSLSRGPQNQLIQRQEQLELQVQQLEQRLNRLSQGTPVPVPGSSTPPAGVVKSLTYRSGTSDDRLRIYWADGRVTDLPCTKEQNTLACG